MKLGDAGRLIYSTKVGFAGLCRAAVAGFTGAVLLFNEMKRAAGSKVKTLQGRVQPQKNPEVVTMKKSTLVALLAALAAVAGVLGALYVYVLRREKELDEYEELLFSEEFDDELSDEEFEAIIADSADEAAEAEA